jgi:hypothetical protein
MLNCLISVNLLNKIFSNEEQYNQLINEFHISKKQFPCYDVTKNEKTTLTGLKFELLFNSIFQFADDSGLLLLKEKSYEEFTPDNPRKIMSIKKWLIKAEGSFNIKKECEETLFELPLSYIDYMKGIKSGEDIEKAFGDKDETNFK